MQACGGPYGGKGLWMLKQRVKPWRLACVEAVKARVDRL